MKIVVTGGAGFIGSSVIRNIYASSDHEIINIDKLTYASNLRSVGEISKSKRYFFEKADICDLKKIREIFNKYKPDSVMHLAAESHVDRSIESASDFINTNIIGTYNMLEASREYYENRKGLNRHFIFHHISTDEVFGDLGNSSNLFNELTSYKPSSPYSASKASSDHLVRAWHRTYNLPVVISNCSNNYGPFQNAEKLIPNTIIRALNRQEIPVYGDGSQIRDWLYVEDHAKALYKVMLQGKVGETYNIGGHNEINNIKVVKTILKVLVDLTSKSPNDLKNLNDLIKYVDDRPGHDVRYAIDASKIKKELDWLPEETFETGIKKTVNWYLQNYQK